MNDEAGRGKHDVYWSIEACGWVRSPARVVEIPEPRVVVVSEAGSAEFRAADYEAADYEATDYAAPTGSSFNA